MIAMRQTDVSGCKPVMERAGCKDVRGYRLMDHDCRVLFSIDPSAPGGHYEYHASLKIGDEAAIPLDQLIAALNQIQPANWASAYVMMRSNLLNLFVAVEDVAASEAQQIALGIEVPK